MPKATTKSPIPEVHPEVTKFLLEHGGESAEDSDVSKVLMDLGSTATYISLKRQNERTKEWEYVTKYSVEELAESGDLQERVKDEHGGGKYRGRIYLEDRSVRTVTFSIDPRFKPQVVLPPTPSGVSGVPPAEGLGEIKLLLQQLITLQLNGGSKPTLDPMDMMKSMSEVMRNLQPSAPVAPASAGSGFSEAFSIFKQGVEMGQAASGGEGLGYLPVIEKLAPPVVEALNRLTASRAPVQHPVVAKVEQSNGGQPLKVPTPSTPEQYVQSYLPRILGLAAAKRDPQLYADLVLDQVPVEARDSVYGYLDALSNRPDAIVYLSSLHPGVKEHEAWFAEFLTAIRETFAEETAHEPETSSVGSTVDADGSNGEFMES